jgi:hypothetical protein
MKKSLISGKLRWTFSNKELARFWLRQFQLSRFSKRILTIKLLMMDSLWRWSYVINNLKTSSEDQQSVIAQAQQRSRIIWRWPLPWAEVSPLTPKFCKCKAWWEASRTSKRKSLKSPSLALLGDLNRVVLIWLSLGNWKGILVVWFHNSKFKTKSLTKSRWGWTEERWLTRRSKSC